MFMSVQYFYSLYTIKTLFPHIIGPTLKCTENAYLNYSSLLTFTVTWSMLGGMQLGYIHIRDIIPENDSLEAAVSLTFPVSLKECFQFSIIKY